MSERKSGGTYDDRDSFIEEVINVRRCTKVVKGGRRFSFSALVVAGNQNGQVGLGLGKANVVREAIHKARNKAMDELETIAMYKDSIPHEVTGRYCASKVVMIPAKPGTGVIAGSAVRAVLECVGVQNILTKVYGSKNPLNVARATMQGLRELQSKEDVERLRGVSCDEYE
jgi:small subunit ribosomal protein S5